MFAYALFCTAHTHIYARADCRSDEAKANIFKCGEMMNAVDVVGATY